MAEKKNKIKGFDDSHFEKKMNIFLKNRPKVVRPGESFDDYLKRVKKERKNKK